MPELSVVTQVVSPQAVGYRVFAPGVGSFQVGETGTTDSSRFIPPGDRQPIGWLRFRILASAGSGEASVTPVEKIEQTAGVAQYLIRPDGEPDTGYPSALVGSSVSVLPPAGPRPVGALHAGPLPFRLPVDLRLLRGDAHRLGRAYD